MKAILRTAAIVSFVAAMQASGASAATIINGSFELDPQASGTWGTYSNLVGWAGGAGGIELRNNVEGQAYDGVNFIELDTYQNSFAAQVISTTGGENYVVTFAYSPRSNILDASNGIEVYWNGSLAGTYSGFTTLNDAWTSGELHRNRYRL